jgi:hypothetical protein
MGFGGRWIYVLNSKNDSHCRCRTVTLRILSIHVHVLLLRLHNTQHNTVTTPILSITLHHTTLHCATTKTTTKPSITNHTSRPQHVHQPHRPNIPHPRRPPLHTLHHSDRHTNRRVSQNETSIPTSRAAVRGVEEHTKRRDHRVGNSGEVGGYVAAI